MYDCAITNRAHVTFQVNLHFFLVYHLVHTVNSSTRQGVYSRIFEPYATRGLAINSRCVKFKHLSRYLAKIVYKSQNSARKLL